MFGLCCARYLAYTPLLLRLLLTPLRTLIFLTVQEIDHVELLVADEHFEELLLKA